MQNNLGGVVVLRRHRQLLSAVTMRPRHCTAALCCPSVFFGGTHVSAAASQRRHGRLDALLPFQRPSRADAQPATQVRPSRPRLQRTSLLDQLQHADNPNSGEVREGERRSTRLSALVAPSRDRGASKGVASPYITSPQFLSAARQAEANAVNAVSRSSRHSATVATPAASLQLQDQQRSLRDAFTHARQQHNVMLKKDPRVYRAECRAFRQSHQGRSPTRQEVSPTVAVPLAPVSALKTLAHTDRARSSLHSATEDAILLHNAVVKNELVKSNTPQLVRCLRCFHVYAARPRTLWGGEVEQSGIEYEKVQARLAADQQLQRQPWLRKHIASVGRRQRAQKEDPTCCPQCGSPRAQWMMEYVHHHTHEKP
ncbi:hypothetical protein N2W54_003067 [Lotmaria passim]